MVTRHVEVITREDGSIVSLIAEWFPNPRSHHSGYCDMFAKIERQGHGDEYVYRETPSEIEGSFHNSFYVDGHIDSGGIGLHCIASANEILRTTMKLLKKVNGG